MQDAYVFLDLRDFWPAPKLVAALFHFCSWGCAAARAMLAKDYAGRISPLAKLSRWVVNPATHASSMRYSSKRYLAPISTDVGMHLIIYIYIDVRWVESHQSLERKAIAAHLLSWDYSAACFAVKLSKIGSDIINSWPREGPVINQGWRPGICMESCKRTCIPDLAVLCWVPAPSGGGAHWRTPHGFIQGNALGSRQRQWYDEGATWIARKYLYSTLRPHCCECWRQPRKQTVDGIAWYYCICIWPHFHFKCHGKASQTFVFFGSSLSCLEITFARFGKCKSPTSGEWIQSIKCLDRCFCCTSLHCTQWNLKRLERMPSVT